MSTAKFSLAIPCEDKELIVAKEFVQQNKYWTSDVDKEVASADIH